MISPTAEHALRAIVYLASEEGQPRTTRQISEATNTPEDNLTEVMKKLRRSGVVKFQRGLADGYRLARESDTLTVLDVVTAVGAFHRMENCPLGPLAETSGLCPLHRQIDNLWAAAEKAPDQVTIGELLQSDPNLLCRLPCISEGANRSAP